MKVLVIGGGGREHALCWKISRSPLVKKLYCAPGNAGTATVAENLPIAATDIPALLKFAKEKSIDLTVVGPEDPLCAGIVDQFEKEKLRIFGPNQQAAELEGSKSFMKSLLMRHKIPTASYRSFDNSAQAMAFLETSRAYPIVIKASGLAAGKGVTICQDREQAREAIEKMMESKVFGEAGTTIVIEEFLKGEEVSILTLTDGETIVPFEPAQDHKQVFDNDQGPNTGGMGAISPTPIVNSRVFNQIEAQILIPTIHAMNREGRKFKGILFAGLMLTATGPKVLEFNVRFGDPETEAILMRFRSDIVPYLVHAADSKLSELEGIEWEPKSAVTVFACSGGYPGNYEKGKEIQGLNEIQSTPELQVFHAGTQLKNGVTLTAGGRVLAVSALGDNFVEARDKAYGAMSKIKFSGMHYRKDIGEKALKKP